MKAPPVPISGHRPRKGDFGWQALTSAFEATVEDMSSDASLFGMPPEALYLWGTLRDEDGNMYDPMRRIPWGIPGSAPDQRRRFFLQTTLDSDAFQLHPIGRESAVNDGHTRTVEDGVVHWRSAPEAAGRPFHVQWTPRTCRWVEEGVLDVRGTLIEPGMQWMLPGREAGMAYIANIFMLEGECLGRKVRGLIGFDVIHMPLGGEVYKQKDALVQEELELLWFTWATIYKDGSIDAGHFIMGHDLFGMAILTDEAGTTRFTYDVDCNVSYATDPYWTDGIRVKAFGEDWEFLPDPKGRMPGLGPIPNPQTDGRWRRVGDTREPDVWFAWGETAPSHGTRPVHRLPGAGQRISMAMPRFSGGAPKA